MPDLQKVVQKINGKLDRMHLTLAERQAIFYQPDTTDTLNAKQDKAYEFLLDFSVRIGLSVREFAQVFIALKEQNTFISQEAVA